MTDTTQRSLGARRGCSLPALITVAMLLLIGSTTAAVAWSGFRGAQRTVDELWRELAESLAQQTTSETLRFLGDAEPHTRMSAQLIEDGTLDPSNSSAFLTYLEHGADAFPAFTWVSYGDARDGNFMGMFRPGPDQNLIRRRRASLGDDSEMFFVDEQRTAQGWADIGAEPLPYDPRERPWFQAVADHPTGQGAWVDPYLFHGRNEPGVTYAMPARHPITDALLGVFCVDFEMAPLSRFLGNLRVGHSGRAYLLTTDGWVIGHPEGQLVRETVDGPTFWTAVDHPDPMLSSAWRAQRELEDPWAPYEVEDMLAVATPFPVDTEIPWVVLTVVPRADLLGHAASQAQQAALYGVVAMGLAMLMGIGLSWVLGDAVERLRSQLIRLARLELEDAPPIRSWIRELNDMGLATSALRQGLSAFSRYVPHPLVRQLLASGQEAHLGAERRELTVLFSDIEGFASVVESTAPDTVLDALGAYLNGMNEAIARHDGVVAQYLGDGIMAFWGAPDDLADHAAQSCLGALAMQEHSDTLLRAAQGDEPRLPTRIGIDTGDVMVGNIGAPDRFNYGILGDTVNTASRLESLNKVYRTRVIAGPRTVELARALVLFRPVDRVRLRGKRKPVLVYEAIGRREEVDDGTLAWVAGYTAALEVYFQGRFTEARVKFESVLAQRPDDGPSSLMIARCARYEKEPPPPDWNGVHTQET